jgi:hypothetical protein
MAGLRAHAAVDAGNQRTDQLAVQFFAHSLDDFFGSMGSFGLGHLFSPQQG